MEPIVFEESNVVYGKGQPEYKPLPAQKVGSAETGQIITCWELSKEELESVKKSGRIYVSLLTFGQPLQPLFVSVEYPEIYDDNII